MSLYTLNKTSSLWFCGLSGAGKTTISQDLKALIQSRTDTGVVLLDGDELVELFSNAELDHSEEARVIRVKKYLRLVGILLKTPKIIPLVVMINHSQKLRDMIRESPLSGNCFEIFVNTSLQTCKKRDPKGHYSRAAGAVSPKMIGIDLPFDIPVNPSVTIHEADSVKESAEKIFQSLVKEEIFILND